MARDDGWMADGACVTHENPNLWFPKAQKGKPMRAKEAKVVCRGCPVRHACLKFAVAHNIRYGVWGGMTPSQRQRIPKILRIEIRRSWFERHPTAQRSLSGFGQALRGQLLRKRRAS